MLLMLVPAKGAAALAAGTKAKPPTTTAIDAASWVKRGSTVLLDNLLPLGVC